MSIPPVIRAAWVHRSPEDAFAVFSDEIGAWWPLPSHGLFGERSAAVVFRDQKLVEQSADGSEAVWAEVLEWEPPSRLVMTWHPGQDASDASQVEVVFEPEGDGTRVTIEHRGWEVFGDDGSNRRLGYVGPNAWGYVLDHFGDGAEVWSGAADVSGLVSAYDEFFATAESGGFGAAPEGEWNAEQVLAHVALNDAAMLCVNQAIVHRTSTRFENEVCQDPEVLGLWIESAGSMDELITRGRDMARLVTASLQRLAPDQLSTEVACRLLHDGQIMLERDMPWLAVAIETQAGMHIPAHIEQLRNLR
jgi:uncharacterized protein YndB with AHSA1/START domain